MDDFGLAEIFVWAVVHGFAQTLGGYLLERLREHRQEEHPLHEQANAVAYQLQEHLSKQTAALETIAEALAYMAESAEEEPERNEPAPRTEARKRGAR